MISILHDRSVDQPIVVGVTSPDKVEDMLTDYIKLLNREGHSIDTTRRVVLAKRDNFVSYGYFLIYKTVDYVAEDTSYCFSISTHIPNQIDSVEIC